MKNLYILVFIVAIFSKYNSPLYAQWIRQESGTLETITGVVMLDSVNVIAVGRYGAILRTTNSGSTWFNTTAHLSYIVPWNNISFSDSANGIVVGDNGVVFVYFNNGKNIIRSQVLQNRKLLSAAFINPYEIFVGADSGWIFRSHDSGKTWASEKISQYPIRSLFTWRGIFRDSQLIFALTPNSIFTKNIFSVDTNEKWQEKILTNFQWLGSEAYFGRCSYDNQTVFIVGVQGDWRPAPAIVQLSGQNKESLANLSGIDRNGVLLGLATPSEKTVYACGSGGIILKSTDSGNTWSISPTNVKNNLNAIHFYNEQKGFAVGDSGIILFTSNGGLTQVDDRDKNYPDGFSLEQNYPNPFNPVTIIRFNVPTKSFVTLKIFDALGRECTSLVSEELPSGSYSRKWNAENKSGGVYYYRLQTGASYHVKKMILLR